MNKIIWSYWHQGLDKAPPVVKPCIQQWINLNQDWEFRFIDQYSMYDYIEPLGIAKETLDQIPLAVSSDLYKLQLLIKYGGVWVDATTFPLLPINDWLPNKMDAGYFFYYRPGRDRIISSWFIAAEKNNELLKKVYKNLKEYWNNNTFKNLKKDSSSSILFLNKLVNRNLFLTKLWFTPLFTKFLRLTPYFVTHYMIYKTISHDMKSRQNFKKMVKVSANPSHVFKNSILMEPLCPDLKEFIDNKKTPVIKLGWRAVGEDIPLNSNLAYLFRQSNNL
jgi:mannosyltransferase OCH1-like enzyme